jgi:hypothetical protein
VGFGVKAGDVDDPKTPHATPNSAERRGLVHSSDRSEILAGIDEAARRGDAGQASMLLIRLLAMDGGR